ncbi:ASCH domain-containing protein [Sporomusa acidovorans]|uniref:ASCH domain-containing protein n=1 Tax=Sporomusa acidovorans (strain ATCC 49682 / DSM 3132 / Mol) TaxID=1123286 RepID=A0ABZ3JAL9_SPOA4|nr:ASCH domain-containing protein [Sporomusa acidovorans]OZC21605.1 ASCH domain protein [Sporomusa acidovorans DSM 3132]SDD63224.1 ASCH domain-containing protein [Sporomusa acidovorans]
MKAITILQPWASLIACGAKKIETRSWPTKYRGPIAIHAGKGWTMDRRKITYRETFHSALWPNMTKQELMLNGYGRTKLLPVGAVIAIADLVDCQRVVLRVKMKNSGQFVINYAELENRNKVAGNELDFGDYEHNRYAWILENVRRIEPVPARGMQRLWEWNSQILS